jgi:hypothetical protein
MNFKHADTTEASAWGYQNDDFHETLVRHCILDEV